MSRRRKSSIVRAWLLLFCVAPIGALGNDVVDRLPFRLKVDLEVSGQPVTIDRVVECRGVMREHPGPAEEQAGKPMFSTMKRRIVWERFPLQIHHLLPSRELVTVYVPSICETWSKRLRSLQVGYMPTIEWRDDASDVKRRETYLSPRYFEHAAARVKFKSISVEATTSPPAVSDPKPKWSRVSREWAERALISVFVRAYTRDVWDRLPPTAKSFAALREVSDVTSDQLIGAIAQLGEPRPGVFGLGINVSPAESRARRYVILDDIERPLSRDPNDPGLYRVLNGPPGFKVYEHYGTDFPQGRLPAFLSNGLREGVSGLRIEYRHREFTIRRASLLIFDPDSQNLLRVGASIEMLGRGD